MPDGRHSEESYFIAYFYIRTKPFNSRYDKYGFNSLRDITDMAYDTISHVEVYYTKKYPKHPENGQNNSRKAIWSSYIQQKGNEFYKHKKGPKLPKGSRMNTRKRGNLNDLHDLIIEKWSDKPDDVLYAHFLSITSKVVQNANEVPPTPRGRKPVSIDEDTIQSGYVYIIENTNPAFEGWKKIGKTSDLHNRMKSFRTYEPNLESKFRFLKAFKSEHALEIEQRTHHSLNLKLANDQSNSNRNGEWYFISLDNAIEEIKAQWFGSDFPKPEIFSV